MVREAITSRLDFGRQMRTLLFLLGVFLTSACPAQTFPQPGKPIRVLVGFAARGGTDIHARQLPPKLPAAPGATVIVENKPGAGPTTTAAEVAPAAPTGYTLISTLNGT